MIRLILFDLDVTLVDSEKHYMDGTIKMMKRLGYDGSEDRIYRIIGTTMDETYNILEKCLDFKVSRDNIISANESFFNVENPINYQELIFDDVIRFLKKFKEEGYKLAMCSQSEMKLINKFISDCKLEGIFDYIASGEDIENGKPSPDIYLNALDFFKISNEDALVYEDSYFGIKAAKNANIKVVARIDDRYGVNQDEADYKVDNIEELYKLIRRIKYEK